MRILHARHHRRLGRATRRVKAPTEAQVRDHLQGHICRCGTYPRIVEAVLMAAKAVRHA